jgi:hypothetical protein
MSMKTKRVSSSTLPTYGFSDDPDTGVGSSAANTVGLIAGGATIAEASSTGLAVTGTVVATGGISTSSSTARVEQVAVQSLTGAALNAAVVGWQNPTGSDILVTRVILNLTTVATAACTLDVGVTAVSATTTSDTLLDGIDANAAIGVFDSMNAALDAGANAKAQLVSAGKWVTFDEKTGDATGLVAKAYIFYVVV